MRIADCNELGKCRNQPTWRYSRSLQVVDLDQGTDGRRSIGELPRYGRGRCLLAQCDHARGRQNRDVSRAQSDRRIGSSHGQRDFCSEAGLQQVLLVDFSRRYTLRLSSRPSVA